MAGRYIEQQKKRLRVFRDETQFTLRFPQIDVLDGRNVS